MTGERDLQKNETAIKTLFEVRYPISKGNGSAFWQGILNNTISTQELLTVVGVHMRIGKFESQTFQASVDLLELRASGLVPFPPSEISEGAQS